MIDDKTIQRFWKKVDKTTTPDGCWIWKAGTFGSMGYGLAYNCSTQAQLPAHRLSYMIHFGSIPDKMIVRHNCNSFLCVNPSHLFLSTREENTAEMLSQRKPKPEGPRDTSWDDNHYTTSIKPEGDGLKVEVKGLNIANCEFDVGSFGIEPDCQFEPHDRSMLDDPAYLDWPESKDFYDQRIEKPKKK